MSLIRKIAVNNTILISERLLTAAAGFFVSVWLIRYFGSEKFGVYSLVFAWFTFLNIFSPAMIEQVVAREAVRFPGQMRKYLGAGVVIKVGLAFIGWAAGMTAAYLLGYPRSTLGYLAITLLSLAGNASYVLQVPHQIELKLLKPALADGVSNIFYQAGRAAMILLKLGLLPFFWLYLAFRLLQLAFFFALGLENKKYRPDWHFTYLEVEEIFRASWILLINNIFVMVISRIDQLLIYPIWGARAVGLYGSCANLTDYLILIPSVWYLTIFPLITRYLGESPSAYKKANHYSFKYMTITSVCFWIVFAGFSKEVIQWLFGADYVEAKDALFWLSTSMVMSFICMGLFTNAISRGKEKKWLLVNGSGALVNVTLNLILMPKYGIAGSGFATFSAFFIQALLTGALKDFRPDFKIMLRATILPISLGGILVAVSRFFSLGVLSGLPIILAAYLILLVITRAINEKDLKMFWKAIKPGDDAHA